MTTIKIASVILGIAVLIWLGYTLNKLAFERYQVKPFNWATCAVAIIGVGFLAAGFWLFTQSDLLAEDFTNRVLNLDFSLGVDEIVASVTIGFITLVALYLYLLAQTDLFIATISYMLILVFAITIVGLVILWFGRRFTRGFSPRLS